MFWALRILVVLVVLFILYRVILFVLGRSDSPLTVGSTPEKCRTCEHAARLFHDGVICRYGEKETFKNLVHIDNCPDYRREL